ncbi:hypothetical protein B0H14DRAFT_2596987 [Mycena olivaceomarginata]|nr:hypothetical protein B0H14DRAFT_2596987 [Mycena olivaceomarginata]
MEVHHHLLCLAVAMLHASTAATTAEDGITNLNVDADDLVEAHTLAALPQTEGEEALFWSPQVQEWWNVCRSAGLRPPSIWNSDKGARVLLLNQELAQHKLRSESMPNKCVITPFESQDNYYISIASIPPARHTHLTKHLRRAGPLQVERERQDDRQERGRMMGRTRQDDGLDKAGQQAGKAEQWAGKVA